MSLHRKPRAEGLNALKPAIKRKVAEWLDSHTYKRTAEMLLEVYGVKTSSTSLSSFYARLQKEETEIGGLEHRFEVILSAPGARSVRVHVRPLPNRKQE